MADCTRNYYMQLRLFISSVIIITNDSAVKLWKSSFHPTLLDDVVIVSVCLLLSESNYEHNKFRLSTPITSTHSFVRHSVLLWSVIGWPLAAKEKESLEYSECFHRYCVWSDGVVMEWAIPLIIWGSTKWLQCNFRFSSQKFAWKLATMALEADSHPYAWPVATRIQREMNIKHSR